MIHGRGDRHGRRDEVLHLARTHVVFLEVAGERNGVFERRARVAGDEIRDEVLLFAGRFARLAEGACEALVALDTGLFHAREHFSRRVQSLELSDIHVQVFMVVPVHNLGIHNAIDRL